MTIEGLTIKPEVPAVEQYRAGTPDNVSDVVGTTIEAYKLLGYTPDEDTATETLTDDFKALAALGYGGRLFARVPEGTTFSQLINAAEGQRRPDSIEPKYIYPNLWTPGTEDDSFTDEALDDGPAKSLARLVLFNANEQTGVDPLLHHLELPADDYARERYNPGKPTQEEETTRAIAQFTSKHPEHNLDQLDHRDFAVLALMDRIRGTDKVDPRSNEFVLNRGWMRVLKLGRHSVGGVSIVGGVDSCDGQLYLDRDFGDAFGYGGVGLSAGLDEASEA